MPVRGSTGERIRIAQFQHSPDLQWISVVGGGGEEEENENVTNFED